MYLVYWLEIAVGMALAPIPKLIDGDVVADRRGAFVVRGVLAERPLINGRFSATDGPQRI